ncbi:hypothetical protein HK101_005050 [Irineochytrium annulatum]|nr:hypothetical protein HK101_005050 [Irineochytrium annulatum]
MSSIQERYIESLEDILQLTNGIRECDRKSAAFDLDLAKLEAKAVELIAVLERNGVEIPGPEVLKSIPMGLSPPLITAFIVNELKLGAGANGGGGKKKAAKGRQSTSGSRNSTGVLDVLREVLGGQPGTRVTKPSPSMQLLASKSPMSKGRMVDALSSRLVPKAAPSQRSPSPPRQQSPPSEQHYEQPHQEQEHTPISPHAAQGVEV